MSDNERYPQHPSALDGETVLYIHGYGSDGNATKGQLLRRMLPQCRIVSPTFDYGHCTPWQIQSQIRDTVGTERVAMIVGSSFGGYHALCATAFFRGTVWAINPVRDVEATIRRVIISPHFPTGPDFDVDMLEAYKDFNAKVFAGQVQLNRGGRWPDGTSLNFALSTDDELLGDHKPLLSLFPCHQQVVWKDDCGHRFLRFEEIGDAIRGSIS